MNKETLLFKKMEHNAYRLKVVAKQRGRQIVVFTAPPGAGKTTVINTIIDLNPELNKIFEKYHLPRLALTFVPGVTTRQLRPGERCGYDFQFQTVPQYFTRLRKKQFLLSFTSTPNFYAIDGPDIEKRLIDSDLFSVFIFNLNAWQVSKLKKAFSKKPWVVFLNAPSAKELERRKGQRGGMTAQEIEFRRRKARQEIKQGKRVSTIQVINDNFTDTIKQCIGFILSQIIFKNNKISGPVARRIQREVTALIRKKIHPLR